MFMHVYLFIYLLDLINEHKTAHPDTPVSLLDLLVAYKVYLPTYKWSKKMLVDVDPIAFVIIVNGDCMFSSNIILNILKESKGVSIFFAIVTSTTNIILEEVCDASMCLSFENPVKIPIEENIDELYDISGQMVQYWESKGIKINLNGGKKRKRDFSTNSNDNSNSNRNSSCYGKSIEISENIADDKCLNEVMDIDTVMAIEAVDEDDDPVKDAEDGDLDEDENNKCEDEDNDKNKDKKLCDHHDHNSDHKSDHNSDHDHDADNYLDVLLETIEKQQELH